jgi:hypothetical protein
MVLGLALSSDNSLVVLTLCSSVHVTPKLVVLEYKQFLLGFHELCSEQIAKCYQILCGKIARDACKKSFRTGFLKCASSLKKSMACVNIDKL